MASRARGRAADRAGDRVASRARGRAAGRAGDRVASRARGRAAGRARGQAGGWTGGRTRHRAAGRARGRPPHLPDSERRGDQRRYRASVWAHVRAECESTPFQSCLQLATQRRGRLFSAAWRSPSSACPTSIRTSTKASQATPVEHVLRHQILSRKGRIAGGCTGRLHRR